MLGGLIGSVHQHRLFSPPAASASGINERVTDQGDRGNNEIPEECNKEIRNSRYRAEFRIRTTCQEFTAWAKEKKQGESALHLNQYIIEQEAQKC